MWNANLHRERASANISVVPIKTFQIAVCKGEITVFQDISVEKLLELQASKNITVVDVRSPAEFEDAGLPDSLNIPLFNNEERAEIGTLYKQVSVEAAKTRGLEIVSAKLPAFVRTFQEVPGKKVVYCWRGGMRSKTSATLLDLMGIPVYRLEGGYRAYRNWVVNFLSHFQFASPTYVINGHTGTGKTAILRQLQAEGFPVLDLEGFAGHRGSIFGHIGLPANNQKQFDSLLAQRLLQISDSPYYLFEGESNRIGKVVLPSFLIESKKSSVQFIITLPLEERVGILLEEYQPWNHHEDYLNSFLRIKNRIHTPIAHSIESHLLQGDYAEAIRLLLIHYYDPRYDCAIDQYDREHIQIDAKTLEEATDKIRSLLGQGVQHFVG